MHRIMVALKWAGGAATFGFIVMFITPLAIGGPGAHQGPLLAFFLTPIVFVVTLILALIWPRLGLITFIASLMYPVWYYVQMPPRDPNGRLVSLSADEQALVRSRHFDARVAVDGGKIPPIYRAKLIEDLGRTGLFSAVAAIEDAPRADLIAIVTGTYYGDKLGHSFSLRWSREPQRSVSVEMWHYAGEGPWLVESAHRLGVERLAIEVIHQMDILGPSPDLKKEK